MKRLSDQDIYERYAERAAILEFDGGLSRERASQLVFNSVGAWCKLQRIPFPQLIRDDYRKVIVGDRKRGSHGDR